jgi:hypothetical protein
VPICSGIGDSSIADCLSQPNSHAGIRYLITGVCHQTANRILHPAGFTVAGTQGYLVSHLAYGTYGLGRWPELSRCVPPGTVLAVGSAIAPSASGVRNPSVGIGVYHSTAGTTAVATEEDSNVAEFTALIETKLGHPVEQPTLDRVMVIQADLRRIQVQLTRWLDTGEITPDQYFEMFVGALRSSMNECRGVLGDQRFKAVFGKLGKHPEQLADRDAFMSQFQEKAAAH